MLNWCFRPREAFRDSENVADCTFAALITTVTTVSGVRAKLDEAPSPADSPDPPGWSHRGPAGGPRSGIL